MKVKLLPAPTMHGHRCRHKHDILKASTTYTWTGRAEDISPPPPPPHSTSCELLLSKTHHERYKLWPGDLCSLQANVHHLPWSTHRYFGEVWWCPPTSPYWPLEVPRPGILILVQLLRPVDDDPRLLLLLPLLQQANMRSRTCASNTPNAACQMGCGLPGVVGMVEGERFWRVWGNASSKQAWKQARKGGRMVHGCRQGGQQHLLLEERDKAVEGALNGGPFS